MILYKLSFWGALYTFFNILQNAQSLSSNTAKPTTYNYFAFGSNMALATMESLRNITPLASTAAVLPGHRLAFNVPGMPFIEPSWASIEPIDSEGISNSNKNHLVHGVLYKLTEKDFVTVCQSEGVPLSYTLHRCQPIPYIGDNEKAGWDTYQKTLTESNNNNKQKDASKQNVLGSVPAYTLRAGRTEWRKGKDIPPSSSYMRVLVRGAREFSIDDDYICMLEKIPTGQTLIGGGVAGAMLGMAEASRKR
mmetsp:Transcript_12855/g.18770  ORF Transcript_12855/g.18770 Transcript_12855/m.18770 type:complete len:250 (+) Transcript_12855:83-832(+)